MNGPFNDRKEVTINRPGGTWINAASRGNDVKPLRQRKRRESYVEPY